MTWGCRIGWLVLFLSAPSWAVEPYGIRTTAKPMVGSSMPAVDGEARYRQSPEAVWRAVNEINKAKYPKVRTLESFGFVGEHEQIHVVMSLPLLWGDLWSVVAVRRDEAKKKLTWSMVDGNMTKNEGSLEISSNGEGSKVRLSVRADPGLFLPDWVVTWGAEHYVKKILRVLGQRLEHEPRAATK